MNLILIGFYRHVNVYSLALFSSILPSSKIDTFCPFRLFHKFNFISLVTVLLQALMHEIHPAEGHINLMVHKFHDEV